MIIKDSLNKYTCLMNFITATTALDCHRYQHNLKQRYALYRENNQVASDADFSQQQYYSPLEVVALEGMLTHVRCLLEFNHLSVGPTGASALLLAAEAGHLDVVKTLLDCEWIRKPIYTKQCVQLWKKSAKSGNLELINYFFNCEPMQNSFFENVGSIMLEAVLEGHARIVERILQEPNVRDTLSPTPFIQRAMRYQHAKIVDLLLDIPTILTFALDHDLSDTYLDPKVQSLVAELREEKLKIKPELCVDIIRYLINKNRPSDDQNIEFLLGTPSVQLLINMDLKPGKPNRLLQLSMEKNHTVSERCLLNMHSVRYHAEINDYYGNTAAKERQKARDHEERIKVRDAFLCLLPWIDAPLAEPTTNQIKINNRIGNTFLPSICHLILQYLLPNPLKKSNVDDEFYKGTMKFFKKIRRIESTQDSISNNPSTSIATP